MKAISITLLIVIISIVCFANIYLYLGNDQQYQILRMTLARSIAFRALGGTLLGCCMLGILVSFLFMLNRTVFKNDKEKIIKIFLIGIAAVVACSFFSSLLFFRQLF